MRRSTIYPLILTILLALNFGAIGAQDNAHKQLFVHTNQSIYFTGDLLQYKLYLSPDFQNHKATIRVSLISEDQKCVEDGFIKTLGNTSISGQIEIPVELSSGMYSLIFSGLSGINKREVQISESKIPIYSDLSNDLLISTTKESKATEKLVFELGLKLELDSIFKIRSQVSGRINVLDSTNNPVNADVSMSVRRKSTLSNTYNSLQKSKLLVDIDPRFIANRIYIQGALKANPRSKKFPVIGVYKPSENIFNYLKTDDKGIFMLPIEDFSGTKSMQFLSLENRKLDLVFNTPKSSVVSPSLIVNKEIIALIDQSKKRKKINQLFPHESITNALHQTEWTQKPKNENARYFLNTYESFPDLATMFGEINSPMKYRIEKNGEHIVRVFNGDQYRRGFYAESPIFIVDGLITKDAESVNDLDIKKIEKVEIVSSNEILRSNYGPIGQNGIVFITTTSPEIVLAEAESNGFIVLNGLKSVSGIIPREAQLRPHHIPSFKSHLLWSTRLESTKTGAYDFSFYQSDDLGDFEIEVFVRATDGRIGYYIFPYEVTK